MPWVQEEPQQLQDRVEWLRRARGKFDLDRDFIYGIFSRDESQVLGGTGLHTRVGEGAREIGYWIHQDHVNQGLATEVAAALTKVAFEIDGVNRVEIHCDPRNVRSAAIPRKLGFVHEATLRQRTVDAKGESRDTMIWTLLAHEYPTSPASSTEIEAFDAIGRRIDVES
jgi:RimJ/RimL family protein N-acetyltransferase